ncbi:MAG: hypothetical protein ACYC0X_23500 [Pirellulaceae bacterium]
MDANLMALIGKALKDEELFLEPGRYEFDELVTLHVCGTVRKENDTLCSPTVSIPLIPTLALFWEKPGIKPRQSSRNPARPGSEGRRWRSHPATYALLAVPVSLDA